MSVEEFAKKVEQSIFPEALAALKELDSTLKVAEWRKHLLE
jgi:hypothetical protein